MTADVADISWFEGEKKKLLNKFELEVLKQNFCVVLDNVKKEHARVEALKVKAARKLTGAPAHGR